MEVGRRMGAKKVALTEAIVQSLDAWLEEVGEEEMSKPLIPKDTIRFVATLQEQGEMIEQFAQTTKNYWQRIYKWRF
jgi:hypothetical protein